jgi:hypothetical protein
MSITSPLMQPSPHTPEGRHPHCHFRGLLRLYSRYGPPNRSAALRRPLSRGSDPSGCPAEPLVSYRTNRQLSGWNLPPLMVRAFGAHEVLRDIIPGLSRVTALWDPTTGASQVTMTASAALSLNLKLQVLEVRPREDVAGAIRAARDSQAEALNVFSSPVLASLHREIIAFAAEYRLPAIYQWKEHVEAGYRGQGPQGR